MKVYVDELPKSCNDCPCFYDESISCQVSDKWLPLDEEDNFSRSTQRHLNCPLKLLADYTKQVRKEVLADLKEKYKQKMANALDDDEEIGHMNCDDVLEELLEEIGFDEMLELYRRQGKWYTY